VPEIIVHAGARREIKAYGIYLEEHAGPEVAGRFLASLKDTFDALATMPKMGPLCGFRRAATRRLRRWPVKDFARDIERLLDG
jgi:plasmid stabilization system protein ParE